MSRYVTYIKQHKVILIVDAFLLVAYILVTCAAHNKAAALYSQQEASRWENDEVKDVASKDSGDKNAGNRAASDKKIKLSELVGGKSMPYAQVSAFISPGRGMGSDELNGVRSSLQETLVKDSHAESQTGGRVWIDAYSCETNISLRKDSNTLSVTAVGVGGEFFQFHPMTLLSGSYISDSDLNHDRIVVDENFAWAMFGSNDIIGMQVWLGDNIYFISGVVKVDEDNISELAYGNGNRVYMYYDELKKRNDSLPITCYEAVFPNPISNYAFYALRTAFGLSDESDDQLDKKDNPLSFDDVEVIENTNRYDTMELITNLKHWRLRSMRASAVGYPFWENVARVQDDTQMVLLLIRCVLLICPIISCIWLIYGLWELKTWTVKGILLEEIDKARERRAWKAYEARLLAEEAEKGLEAGLLTEEAENVREAGLLTEEAENVREAGLLTEEAENVREAGTLAEESESGYREAVLEDGSDYIEAEENTQESYNTDSKVMFEGHDINSPEKSEEYEKRGRETLEGQGADSLKTSGGYERDSAADEAVELVSVTGKDLF